MDEGKNQVQALVNGNGEMRKKKKKKNRISSLLATEDRDYLLSPTGHQVRVSDLEGKVVGLYFAANWYPQCRTFTQLLVSVYDQIKSQTSGLEIVFVSSDEDAGAFQAFRSSMPWLAVPFSDLHTKKALSNRFDVEGIPCLVILQPGDVGEVELAGEDEEVIWDGVELVYRYGADAFPFTKEKLEALEREERERHEQQTLMNLLTNHERDHLLGHHLTRQVSVASLSGKTVGLYFSAQWCLPCVKFTPKLISIYHKIRQTLVQENTASDGDFEIVFVSSDRDEPSFASYFTTMPWLALPHGDPNIKALVKHFDVRDIPCLVILGPDGKTVTKQGRNLINYYQEKAFPFTDDKIEYLERQMDEEAKSLPGSVRHVGHMRHELSLVSEGTGGGPFICCRCDEQGSGWVYLCLKCGYEVHPRCVRAADGVWSTAES